MDFTIYVKGENIILYILGISKYYTEINLVELELLEDHNLYHTPTFYHNYFL